MKVLLFHNSHREIMEKDKKKPLVKQIKQSNDIKIIFTEKRSFIKIDLNVYITFNNTF